MILSKDETSSPVVRRIKTFIPGKSPVTPYVLSPAIAHTSTKDTKGTPTLENSSAKKRSHVNRKLSLALRRRSEKSLPLMRIG